MPKTAYEFLTERNDRLALALAVNTDLAAFIQAVLEHLIDRAESRGEALEDIEVEPPEIVRQGHSYYVRARIR